MKSPGPLKCARAKFSCIIEKLVFVSFVLSLIFFLNRITILVWYLLSWCKRYTAAPTYSYIVFNRFLAKVKLAPFIYIPLTFYPSWNMILFFFWNLLYAAPLYVNGPCPYSFCVTVTSLIFSRPQKFECNRLSGTHFVHIQMKYSLLYLNCEKKFLRNFSFHTEVVKIGCQ